MWAKHTMWRAARNNLGSIPCSALLNCPLSHFCCSHFKRPEESFLFSMPNIAVFPEMLEHTSQEVSLLWMSHWKFRQRSHDGFELIETCVAAKRSLGLAWPRCLLAAGFCSRGQLRGPLGLRTSPALYFFGVRGVNFHPDLAVSSHGRVDSRGGFSELGLGCSLHRCDPRQI